MLCANLDMMQTMPPRSARRRTAAATTAPRPPVAGRRSVVSAQNTVFGVTKTHAHICACMQEGRWSYLWVERRQRRALEANPSTVSKVCFFPWSYAVCLLENAASSPCRPRTRTRTDGATTPPGRGTSIRCLAAIATLTDNGTPALEVLPRACIATHWTARAVLELWSSGRRSKNPESW